MGQYYKACILDAKNRRKLVTFVSPYTHDNFAKLNEHGWIGNRFVNVVEYLLTNGPKRVCWAGDYADKCSGYRTNLYDRAKKQPESEFAEKVGWVSKRYRFIVNHTKKQFIDKRKVVDNDGWRVHPLPLMTAECNGGGGGDYYGVGKELVGTWARNLISLELKAPEGYKEIIVPFVG